MTKKRNPLSNTVKTHLVCRDLHHSWTWVTDIDVQTRIVRSKRTKTMTRVIECERCGTQRTDEYAIPSFERIRSMYTYTEGYLAKNHGTHIRVADVRAEVYRRIMTGAWSN